MNPSADRYARLPARGFSLVHWDTLWHGSDHLLSVRASLGADSYRRFFYRDIEAIVLRRTSGRLWINVILLVFAAFSSYPLIYYWALMPFERLMAFTAVFAAVPLVLAIINTARGPTCDVRIQTAVQSERVAALSRERAARRVLEQIRPMIHAAQSHLQPSAASAAPGPFSGPATETAS